LNGKQRSIAASRLSAPVMSILVMSVLAGLAGCAAKPAKPVPARAQLVVSADANPDASGRPSPIVVRLFQLRADGEFAAADFFALYDKEKEVLGQSFISREEYVLAPGETRSLEIPLDGQARYIAALAAFRDIRSARWRAVTKAPEKTLTDLLGKDGVTINVGKDALTLNVKD
jgi:type VI secretion system protein VasD